MFRRPASNWLREALLRPLQLEALELRTVLSAFGVSSLDNHAGGQPDARDVVLNAPAMYRMLDISDGYLSEPSAGDPLDVAYGYLTANAAQLGVTAQDVLSSQVTDQYVSSHTGVTHIYLSQTRHSLPVVNATLNINVAADGRVINVGSRFIRDIADLAGTPRWETLGSPAAALHVAAQRLGLRTTSAMTRVLPTTSSAVGGATLVNADLSQDAIPVNLFYAPTSDGGVSLAWNLVLRTPDNNHWYDVGVDVQDGRLVYLVDWVNHLSYNVFPLPVEAPNDGERAVVVDPADPVASPYGWHDTDGVPGPDTRNTSGNNVFAQEDVDFNNTGGYRPGGGASLDFDYRLPLDQDPNYYEAASITNLFYVNNLLHDVHYQYGFDEPAGNFQLSNYGRGGLGGDPVQADAQEGNGINNANFFTPPDGLAPRMQMFLWNRPLPLRDSALDNQIIVHEYGHGVSNRLTGGPSNSGTLSARQSGGMGEGWSDWWALMFTQKSTDTMRGGFGVGTYSAGQPNNGRGVRNSQYSFDLAIDHQSYRNYNDNPSVHSIGEIWASALWDMNWLLIDRYGFDPNLAAGYTAKGSAGNVLALQLVMDALKLQPALPTMLDGRDAILLADQVLTGGANQEEIWTAFARRGMGLSAFDGGSPNAHTVAEAFDLPIFGLTVVATDPPLQLAIDTQPVSFTLDFSYPLIPESIDASDLTINRVTAEGFTLVDADTVTFHFSATPVAAEGPQLMEIAKGALARASDTAAGLAWQGVFYYDRLPQTVVDVTPEEGLLLTARPDEIVLHFKEDVSPASLNASDLVLDVGQAVAAELVDSRSVRFQVDGLVGNDGVRFTLPAGAVTDIHGTPAPEYTGTFRVDDPRLKRYEPLEPWQPVGRFQTNVYALDVPDFWRIADLEVELDIFHVNIGQLKASLLAPDGTRVVLFDFDEFRTPRGADLSGTVFDDDASSSINNARGPFTGRFRPPSTFNGLSLLDGKEVAGTWRLQIDSGAARGILQHWALVVTPDPRITVGSPPVQPGARLDAAPVDFPFQFTEAVDPTAIDVNSFTVNGFPADRWTQTAAAAVVFHFDASPASTEGPQVVELHEGALATLAGLSNVPWHGTFFYDRLPLAVGGATPAEDARVSRFTEIVIDFNEPIRPESVDAEDLVFAPHVLNLPPPTATSAEQVDADSVRFLVEVSAELDGRIHYELPAGAVTDVHGSPNVRYAGTVRLDNPLIKRFSAEHVPAPIRDRETTVSKIDVPNSLIVGDLDVEVDITHPNVGDLELTLVAPNGERVFLFIDRFAGGANFTKTVFDADAATSIWDASAPYTGHFQPAGGFESVRSHDAAGTWHLLVADKFNRLEGTLNRWSLVFAEVPELWILGSSPDLDQRVDNPPVDFTIRFNDAVDPATLQAADLRVNDRPAGRFTLESPDRVVFHFNTSPVSGQGPQSMAIEFMTLKRASNGLTNVRWFNSFFYDAVPLQVVATTPSVGAVVQDAQPEIVLRFNENIDSNSVDAGDLRVSSGTVTAAQVVRGRELHFTVEGMNDEGVITYELPPGMIADVHGVPGPGHSGAFRVDRPFYARGNARDVPLALADLASTTSIVRIEDQLTISDLAVELDITHPGASDLAAILTGPDGTRVVLFAGVGDSGDHFTLTTFDDAAAVGIEAGRAPFSGTFRPTEPLAAFQGKPVQGEWQLTVADDFPERTGSLNGWSLLITADAPPAVPGDTNADGTVDVEDLNNVRNRFGASGVGVLGDTWPFDGVVDVADLNAVRNAFGTTGAVVAPADTFTGQRLIPAFTRPAAIRLRHDTNVDEHLVSRREWAPDGSRWRITTQLAGPASLHTTATRIDRPPARLPAWDVAIEDLVDSHEVWPGEW